MKKLFSTFLAVVMLSLLSACGGGDNFRITGEIPGIGTQNLNVIYYGDGVVRSTRTTVVDSKFIFDGKSRDWTVVYFFTNTRALLGMVIIRNGENVKVRYELNNYSATQMSGTKPSQLLGEFMAANGHALQSHNVDSINMAVEDFVVRHRDNLAATVALINFYDASHHPATADSLFKLIDPKVRPTYMAEGWWDRINMVGDTTRQQLPVDMTFIDVNDSTVSAMTPGRMLVLYSPTEPRDASVDALLETRITKKVLDSLKVNFFEIDRWVGDTATWKQSVRGNKKASWKRLWHPINSVWLPFQSGQAFLVADSTGVILYNGDNVNRALEAAHLK